MEITWHISPQVYKDATHCLLLGLFTQLWGGIHGTGQLLNHVLIPSLGKNQSGLGQTL